MKDKKQSDEHKDVLIYEIETRRVVSIPAPDRGTTGFHTIAKALDLLDQRCNENYTSAAVPVGKYKKGDILNEKDL